MRFGCASSRRLTRRSKGQIEAVLLHGSQGGVVWGAWGQHAPHARPVCPSPTPTVALGKRRGRRCHHGNKARAVGETLGGGGHATSPDERRPLSQTVPLPTRHYRVGAFPLCASLSLAAASTSSPPLDVPACSPAGVELRTRACRGQRVPRRPTRASAASPATPRPPPPDEVCAPRLCLAAWPLGFRVSRCGGRVAAFGRRWEGAAVVPAGGSRGGGAGTAVVPSGGSGSGGTQTPAAPSCSGPPRSLPFVARALLCGGAPRCRCGRGTTWARRAADAPSFFFFFAAGSWPEGRCAGGSGAEPPRGRRCSA